MTIREANYELEKLNNDLNKLIKDKAILECLVQPKSTDYSKVVVDGGKHGNALELYILKQDLPRWKDLDVKIKRKQDEINNQMNWIDNELKILKKYDRVEQLIVYYKEIDDRVQMILDKAAEEHLRVWFRATDGDPGVASSHNKFYKEHIHGHTADYAQLITSVWQFLCAHDLNEFARAASVRA